MANPGLSAAKAQEALDMTALHGTVQAAAAVMGISRATLDSRIQTAKSRGMAAKGTGAKDPGGLRDRIRQLEAALRTAERQSSETETIKRIVGNMAEKIETLDTPDWMVQPRAKESAPGVPTLFISDLHWGEVVHGGQINGVNTFNVAIANARMHRLVDSAIHLLRIISPKLDYPGIVVQLGGDMISGNIHEELTATNEINSMPAVLDLFAALVGVVNTLAEAFGHVFLPCVTGNHGRMTTKIWGKDRHATSFDWLLYQFLAKHFEKDKRVQFYVPDGPDAYFRVYGHRYLLTHGDQFRGGDGMIGALGPIIRGDHKKRSRNAQIDMEYDTMTIGHWHQYIHLTRLIVNGSLKGYDEYAYNNNFGFEPPQQALWLTHPKYRITYRMPVYVDSVRASPKTAWVSVAG